jgi:hypothetical protein
VTWTERQALEGSERRFRTYKNAISAMPLSHKLWLMPNRPLLRLERHCPSYSMTACNSARHSPKAHGGLTAWPFTEFRMILAGCEMRVDDQMNEGLRV